VPRRLRWRTAHVGNADTGHRRVVRRRDSEPPGDFLQKVYLGARSRTTRPPEVVLEDISQGQMESARGYVPLALGGPTQNRLSIIPDPSPLLREGVWTAHRAKRWIIAIQIKNGGKHHENGSAC